MHEASLIQNLKKKIHEVAANSKESGRITSLKVKLGALSHISASHFKEHFEQETQGTDLEGAKLEVQELHDLHDPLAQEIILESVSFEVKNE